MEWKYVEKDGNPNKPGSYVCLLVSPEYKSIAADKDPCLSDKDWEETHEETGRLEAFIDVRYLSESGGKVFCGGEAVDDMDGWAMEGEDTSKLFWTEQTGSSYRERVIAWLAMDPAEVPKLPDGAFWTQDGISIISEKQE